MHPNFTDDTGTSAHTDWFLVVVPCRSHFAFKQRNYDPDTRTLRKRGKDEENDNDDTVEKNVEGLAEQIIKEDEEKRKEELVSNISGLC